MKKIYCSIVLLLITSALFAGGKLKTIQGDASVIKGLQLNVIFTYDDLIVGKNLSEKEYIKKKTDEKNKKEAGSGDKWAEIWEMDKQRIYPNKFIALFNKKSSNTGTSIEKSLSTAKYTMEIHTTYIEPGFFTSVVNKPSLINFEVIIYETSNPENIIYKAEGTNFPGQSVSGMNIATGTRIGESYAVAGKDFASFLYKKFFK